MDWPGNLSDLNPMKNGWDFIKAGVYIFENTTPTPRGNISQMSFGEKNMKRKRIERKCERKRKRREKMEKGREKGRQGEEKKKMGNKRLKEMQNREERDKKGMIGVQKCVARGGKTSFLEGGD